MINLDIQMELQKLDDAVKRRARLNCPGAGGTVAKKQEAEYKVHLHHRALYSRFHSDELWAVEGLGEETRTAVAEAMEKGTACVTVDPRCVKSVQDRLTDFKEFLSRPRSLLAM